MSAPRYPSLYQLNTRVRLTELSRQLGRPATLDDLPDAELDELTDLGFDWIWLLGVWETGETGRQVSRTNPEWQEEFRDTLPDLRQSDICGSCFAITSYKARSDMGGNAAMARLRSRIQKRGLRLMLDFVPNHMAPDHPWVEEHPGFFIQGTDANLQREPENYCRIESGSGSLVLAYGRDPYFAGWPDTLQLNYADRNLQKAMQRELLAIAALCDGVRCDMAMLIDPGVFERTWGMRPEPFWPGVIEQVRKQIPDFTFMAEVYWDMEWALQRQGFDYTYDKRLYDRLRDRHARPVREHFYAGLDFQDRLARFLENHDEPRAAAVFPPDVHRAAAMTTYFAPGLRFFHQGQLEGRRKRIAPHLCRGPDEPIDEGLKAFYQQLLEWLEHPTFRDGDWQLLECAPVTEGDETWDGFIASAWKGARGTRLIVAVNYADQRGQCRVRLPFADIHDRICHLIDWVRGDRYDRTGNDLLERGLPVELDPWAYAIVELQEQPRATI